MNILITGSRGFIGQHLISTLSLDSTYKMFPVVSEKRSDVTEIECNLRDKDSCLEVLKATNPDVIFHLVGSFSNDFSEDLENNVMTTRNILDSVFEYNKAIRVIVIGSAAEYGEAQSDFIGEVHSTLPLGVYGLTKLYQTLLAQFYVRTKGLDVVVARLFNVYGRGISEKLFAGMIEKKISEFNQGKTDKIYLKNVSHYRDYIHVDDVVKFLIKLMKFGSKGDIYNIGSGRAVQILEFAKERLKIYGLDESVIEILPALEISDNEIKKSCADISKINFLPEVLSNE